VRPGSTSLPPVPKLTVSTMDLDVCLSSSLRALEPGSQARVNAKPRHRRGAHVGAPLPFLGSGPGSNDRSTTSSPPPLPRVARESASLTVRLGCTGGPLASTPSASSTPIPQSLEAPPVDVMALISLYTSPVREPLSRPLTNSAVGPGALRPALPTCRTRAFSDPPPGATGKRRSFSTPRRDRTVEWPWAPSAGTRDSVAFPGPNGRVQRDRCARCHRVRA